MQDRYGNEVSTGSRAALDAYIEGVDHFLAAPWTMIRPSPSPMPPSPDTTR